MENLNLEKLYNLGLAGILIMAGLMLVAYVTRQTFKKDGWIWILVAAVRDFLARMAAVQKQLADLLEAHDRRQAEQHDAQNRALADIRDQL